MNRSLWLRATKLRGGWIPLASGAQGVALACGAATNLLYARLLAPAQIGKLAILLALATALVLLADLGLQLLVTRELARGRMEPRTALGLLLRTLPFLVLLWWSVIAACAGLAGLVSWHLLLFALELGLALWLFQIALTIQQGLGSFGRRSMLVAANGVLTAAFTGVALAFSPTLGQAVHATALAYVLVGGGAVAVVGRRYGVARVPLGDVRALAARALPLWLNSGMTFVTSSADVLLAGMLLPLASVGYYQVFKKLALVALAPLATLLPSLYAHYSSLSSRDRARSYLRTQRIAAALVAGALVVGGPLLPFLIRVSVGASYARFAPVLVALLVVGALQFSHNLLGYVLTAGGRFGRPLAINGAVALTALALAPTLTPFFGLNGFVAALLAANLVGVGVAGALAAKGVVERALPALAATTAGLALAASFASWATQAPLGAVLPIAAAAGCLACVSLVGRSRALPRARW